MSRPETKYTVPHSAIALQYFDNGNELTGECLRDLAEIVRTGNDEGMTPMQWEMVADRYPSAGIICEFGWNLLANSEVPFPPLAPEPTSPPSRCAKVRPWD